MSSWYRQVRYRGGGGGGGVWWDKHCEREIKISLTLIVVPIKKFPIKTVN